MDVTQGNPQGDPQGKAPLSVFEPAYPPALPVPVAPPVRPPPRAARMTQAEKDRREQEAADASAADRAVLSGAWSGANEYTAERVLGRGAFGTVYAARSVRTGEAVAIKRIDGVFASRSGVAQALRELSLHVHVDAGGGRGSVARLVDVVVPDSPAAYTSLFAVFERLGGSLDGRLNDHERWSRIPFGEARSAAQSLVRCVARLHACRVAHRDIKPQNVLVDDGAEGAAPARIVLCDLGMARLSESESGGGIPGDGEDEGCMQAQAQAQASHAPWTDYVTTRWYRPPEVCCAVPSDGTSALAADVWSLGCVLGEMLVGGRPLFRGRSAASQARIIGEALGRLPAESEAWYRASCCDLKATDAMLAGAAAPSGAGRLAALMKDLPPMAFDLIRSMLRYDPIDRVTAEAALQHPFFASESADSDSDGEGIRGSGTEAEAATVRPAKRPAGCPFIEDASSGDPLPRHLQGRARAAVFAEVLRCRAYLEECERLRTSGAERDKGASDSGTAPPRAEEGTLPGREGDGFADVVPRGPFAFSFALSVARQSRASKRPPPKPTALKTRTRPLKGVLPKAVRVARTRTRSNGGCALMAIEADADADADADAHADVADLSMSP